MRPVVRELCAFFFFVLLTVALTWPLAIRITTAASDLGDPLLNTWILDWDDYAAAHGIAAVFQAPIFYPEKAPLAYSENLFGIALVGLPFHLAGCTPLATYNILFLLGFAFCGYGAWILVRLATGSWRAAIVAGVLYAFVPFRLDHLPHIQIIWGGWLPLMLAALLAYWKRPTWVMAAGFGGALLMNGLCNIHYFLFGTLTAALTVFVLAFTSRRADWRFWLRIGAATAVALAFMVPVLWPYKVVSELYQMHRGFDEVASFSATWSDWLTPTFFSRTYGNLVPSDQTFAERHLFPGLLILFLTAAGFVLGRGDSEGRSRTPPLLRATDVVIVALAVISFFGAVAPRFALHLGGVRILSVDSSDLPLTMLVLLVFVRLSIRRPIAWAGGLRLPESFWIGTLWIGVGVLGSLGVHAFFHAMLFRRLEAFEGLRVPARWASIAYVGLALTAGFGAAALLARRSKRTREIVFLLLLALAIYDVRPRPRWQQAIVATDPVYEWIRTAPYRGALLEIPIDTDATQFSYLLSDTAHHRPTLNGFSGFEPPAHARLRELSNRASWGTGLSAEIAHLGAAIVVVHDDWLGADAPKVHQWLRNEITAGRLIFLRRFDHRTGGDYVFAVTANCRDCDRLREPERIDGAGLIPVQNLERMLDGQTTYLGHTFGTVDAPRFGDRIGRSLRVSGWALSPAGIREVDVLLACGTVRIPAALVARPDVRAVFPWYPRVQHAGFLLTVPKRPHGVPKYTDVQVEVIDGNGGRVRLPDMTIDW